MRTDRRKQRETPVVSKQAEKYLAKLELKAYNKITTAILEIHLGNIKPLKGHEPLLRLEVEFQNVSYRIIYEWIDYERIMVYRVAPRGFVTWE